MGLESRGGGPGPRSRVVLMRGGQRTRGDKTLAGMKEKSARRKRVGGVVKRPEKNIIRRVIHQKLDWNHRGFGRGHSYRELSMFAWARQSPKRRKR